MNTPTAFAPAAERLQAACAKTGRHVTSCVLFMVIADETDEAAGQVGALQGRRRPGGHRTAGRTGRSDKTSGSDTNIRQMADPTSAVNINMGTLVGSYANVARMLDEIATVRHAGRDADIRRLHRRHRSLWPEDPAADAEPPARQCSEGVRLMSAVEQVSGYGLSATDEPVQLPARPNRWR